MNSIEHKKYLKEISALADKILSSEADTKKFLVDAGINTPTGRLTKIYSETSVPMGYKIKKEK